MSREWLAQAEEKFQKLKRRGPGYALPVARSNGLLTPVRARRRERFRQLTSKSESLGGVELKALAVISSLGCIGAGLWLLQTEPADSNSIFGPLLHGMGLYFVAKGFFVGPSLFSQWRTTRAIEWLAQQQGMSGEPSSGSGGVKPTAIVQDNS